MKALDVCIITEESSFSNILLSIIWAEKNGGERNYRNLLLCILFLLSVWELYLKKRAQVQGKAQSEQIIAGLHGHCSTELSDVKPGRGDAVSFGQGRKISGGHGTRNHTRPAKRNNTQPGGKVVFFFSWSKLHYKNPVEVTNLVDSTYINSNFELEQCLYKQITMHKTLPKCSSPEKSCS